MQDTPELIELPDSTTFQEAYALLNARQRNEVRSAIVELGISKETFYRWLRTNTVPFVWRQHFTEQLNKHLNVNGKNLK